MGDDDDEDDDVEERALTRNSSPQQLKPKIESESKGSIVGAIGNFDGGALRKRIDPRGKLKAEVIRDILKLPKTLLMDFVLSEFSHWFDDIPEIKSMTQFEGCEDVDALIDFAEEAFDNETQAKIARSLRRKGVEVFVTRDGDTDSYDVDFHCARSALKKNMKLFRSIMEPHATEYFED
ncbi:MAG: hypothetical protein IT288_00515 [Bdellovibrionales bacterium]|nr:hypothetical protein [Bdellovibrionales bacterium]